MASAITPERPRPAARPPAPTRGARIRRVKLLDRLAAGAITLGGGAVILAVCLIFVFILLETLPLFLPAEGWARPAEAAPATGSADALLFGIDEYQMHVYEVWPDGRLVFTRTADGRRVAEHPLDLGGARITAAARSLGSDDLALGTSDGRVVVRRIRFRPRYQAEALVDLDVQVRDQEPVTVDTEGRAVRDVSYLREEGSRTIAALCRGDRAVAVRFDEDEAARRFDLETEGGVVLTHVRVGRRGSVVAASRTGRVYHWELASEPTLTQVVAVSDRAVSALEYTLGGTTLLVGDEGGALSGWFRVRPTESALTRVFVKGHDYPSQGSPIRAIGPSVRGKTFATAGDDGSVAVRHQTSERTLLQFPGTGQGVRSVVVSPKEDAVLVQQADGRLRVFGIEAPHPEVSVRTLFGRVWYEGYARPEFVWQSTGGTDDFEAKLSLVPLIFGTLKGTFYALLFAVPLAILGALYTSQFMHPGLKTRVKPAIEIMGGVPTVVVGFIAGLWLAPRVERAIVPVILMLLVVPVFGTAGVLLWGRLPRGVRRGLKPGTEVAMILPLLLLGGWVASLLGTPTEALLFGGDFRLWLSSALDLVYDQRNSLVVGLAMGFAVIPIIFTISEDAFSSVPRHLSAASLALGASRWQTALRVVLPTASPGVFSAVMIGFGRAVGETMIVLMATGNTPLMDWSIFNGMRTLSANIAVEIPEAPYGGTLFRTLFLAALVLFVMTFALNTAADVVRQRLRDRYEARG